MNNESEKSLRNGDINSSRKMLSRKMSKEQFKFQKIVLLFTFFKVCSSELPNTKQKIKLPRQWRNIFYCIVVAFNYNFYLQNNVTTAHEEMVRKLFFATGRMDILGNVKRGFVQRRAAVVRTDKHFFP